MKKSSAFFCFLIICAILYSCNIQNEQSLIPSFNTPASSVAITPTRMAIRPTWTPILTPTSTITLIPQYPTKQLLLNYEGIGYHSDYEMYFADGINKWSILALYTDGQLIILRDDIYQQKILASDEVNRFFSRLEALGFYIIESNQAHDPTDKLYDFAGKYEEVGVTDGLEYCVLASSIKERDICVYEPYLDYLTPEMKAILKFLDNYQPKGLSLYIPERILLRVENGRNGNDNELTPNTIPWRESSLSIELNCGKICTKVLYVQGERAKELYRLYGSKGHVFTQNGKEYTVYIRVVLPHEEVTNIYDQ